jgi:hypothetical protein
LTQGQPQPAADDAAAVKVAMIEYAGARPDRCFAAGFLDMVARNSSIKVARQMTKVSLDSPDLFNYPFAVFTGENSFTLTEAEKKNLAAYLRRGGFIMASAGCSNTLWADSFRQLMSELFPREKLETLPMKHPVFHTLFEIDELRARKGGAKPVLLGMTRGDRLVMVFCAMGLNDTDNAGGGCCCCGGNELRDAHLLNANLLTYALTH